MSEREKREGGEREMTLFFLSSNSFLLACVSICVENQAVLFKTKYKKKAGENYVISS